MKREQKRLQRKKAQYERSRREVKTEPAATKPEVIEYRQVPDPQRGYDLTQTLRGYMSAMGVPLPLMRLDQLEVIKDAEIAQPDRLEHKGGP